MPFERDVDAGDIPPPSTPVEVLTDGVVVGLVTDAPSDVLDGPTPPIVDPASEVADAVLEERLLVETPVTVGDAGATEDAASEEVDSDEVPPLLVDPPLVTALVVFFFPTVPPTAPPTTAAMMIIAAMAKMIFPLVEERNDSLRGAAVGAAPRVAYFSRGVSFASRSLFWRGGVRAVGGVALLAGAAAPVGR